MTIRRINITHIVSTVCSFCNNKCIYLIERIDDNGKTKVLAYVCEHHNQLPDDAFEGVARETS